MEKIQQYRDKVQESNRRIAELKKSFLAFINLGEDFIFSVEPENRDYLKPYMDEINDLKRYNFAVTKAIQDAKEIYNKLRTDGLVQPENPEELIDVIEGTIHGIQSRIRSAHEKLEKLKVIDKKSLETVILPENKKQADELKKVINVDLPAKIKALEDGKRRIEKLFDGLDIQIPPAGVNLPRREG